MQTQPTTRQLFAALGKLLGHSKARTIAVLLFLTGVALRNNPRLIDIAANTNSLRVLDSKDYMIQQVPWTTIHLLGERHSGTKWMTAHLDECFASDSNRIRVVSALSRWKHWFQEDGAYSSRNSIVVAQFRHVNQWVEAMRVNPYHAPSHFNLTWNNFVSRQWTMERFGQDRQLFETNTTVSRQLWNEPACQYRFRPYQAIPCFGNASIKVPGFRQVFALYELRNDGSGRPYDNLLQLRADKIRNFLNVASFAGVRHLEVVRYEEMAMNGTAPLIRQLEQVLGVKAKCLPTEPQNVSGRPLPLDFEKWMRENVDWETEKLIGYASE